MLQTSALLSVEALDTVRSLRTNVSRLLNVNADIRMTTASSALDAVLELTEHFPAKAGVVNEANFPHVALLEAHQQFLAQVSEGQGFRAVWWKTWGELILKDVVSHKMSKGAFR